MVGVLSRGWVRIFMNWVGVGVFLVLVGCGGGRGAVEYEPSLPSFVDVAEEVGLDFRHGAFRWGMSGDAVAMMGGGVCWLDFDNDGWLDLYVVNSYAVAEAGRWEQEMGGLPRNGLFRNVEGRFEDVSLGSGADLAVRGNGCVAGDLDGDGWTDLYVTTSRFNRLLWNNGDGSFTEGSDPAGLATYGWQSAAVVGDVNGDNLPDIFLAGYVDINNQIEGSTMGFPNTHMGQPDLLYLNEGVDASGRATFREVHTIVGLVDSDPDSEHAYGLGAAMSDIDNDGDLDLFVANDTNPNRLYINETLSYDPQGIGFRFVERGADARVNDINSGMGVASGDFDGDGRFDLFVTNMGQQLHSVYQNASGESLLFQDATSTIGIPDIGVGWTGWGTTWGDFDNDGDLDLFVANGGVPVVDFATDGMVANLYENVDGVLGDVSAPAGLTTVGELIARGSAVADYDNDGDLDIAVASIGGDLVLLENRGVTGNWLIVQLEQFAPGAVVTVTLNDGREMVREVPAGSSYLSSEDPRSHFGLGGETHVQRLHIRWPNGHETIFRNVHANQILRVGQ